MSERLAKLETRLASVRELREVVGAMRALAAARMQQAQALLAATRAYAETVAVALAEAAALLPGDDGESRPRGPTGRILFCAEHGFAGAFSTRVFDAAGTADAGLALFVVGSRGSACAAERRMTPAWTLPMSTHVGAVTTTALRITDELYARCSAGRLAAVDVVFTREATVCRERLLPVDVSRVERSAVVPPVLNLAPTVLVERLIEEYLFAQLSHAAMESLAAENAARLNAMQLARRHIGDKLDELTLVERRIRQEETTSELIEIVTGAEDLLGVARSL